MGGTWGHSDLNIWLLTTKIFQEIQENICAKKTFPQGVPEILRLWEWVKQMDGHMDGRTPNPKTATAVARMEA